MVDGSLTGADVADTSTLGPSDIREESLFFNNTLISGDIGTGAVQSDEVLDNSLTGNDIAEATLAPTTTATFGNLAGGTVLGDSFTKVGGKVLPAGSYAIFAPANTTGGQAFGGDRVNDMVCEIRNGNSNIGGAADRTMMILRLDGFF